MQVWEEECRLQGGAEAVVDAGLWLGRPAIRKERRPRAWRHPDLDARHTKRRMTSEARNSQIPSLTLFRPVSGRSATV